MRIGNSLEVQWLGLHASAAGDTGSIPGWGTKVPQATGCGQKKIDKIRITINHFEYRLNEIIHGNYLA